MTARERRLAGVVLVAALLATSACSGSESGSTDSSNSPSSTERTVQDAASGSNAGWAEGKCPVDVPSDGPKVTCGTLTVPENREEPGGAQVTLPVVRIHSTAATPKPDPVVYLHGGPGIGTLPNGISGRMRSSLLAERDLILFDQRGTGLATPSLECPEREEAFIEVLSAPKPFAEEFQLIGDALEACHARLVAAGHDLDQYNTEANAADLADLRTAMGIDEWNLWGVSYGTRLALATMRAHPDGIRSVALDSVYPPESGTVDDTVASGTRAFDALANGCATDPSCHERYPDVRGDVNQVGRSLDASPFTFDYTAPDGTVTPLTLTGDDAIGGLFNALYDTTLIPQLPAFIRDLAGGGRAIVPLIAQQGIPFVNETTEGAFMSYECADNASKIDAATAEQLRNDPGQAGLLLLVGWNLFCDRWPVAAAPDSFSEPVESAIPTLVIAGEYDPITDPAGSQAVADRLEDSVFVLVPHGGHGPGPDTSCTQGIFTRFFDEGPGVDTSCVATITPAPFS